ncbi:MAG TPA: hypothetical protein PKM44_01915 [Turneriella sp.]|nr:hypothetical protein [Turneriella sp.]
MNDLVILGIVLGGGLGATLVGLFIWQHFEHKRSALELKLFQMENTRLIQQWRDESRRSHEDSMEYLKSLPGL